MAKLMSATMATQATIFRPNSCPFTACVFTLVYMSLRLGEHPEQTSIPGEYFRGHGRF